MTVFVLHGGKLVDRATIPRPPTERPAFPTPGISRMEAYESPVTGKEITSWGERERDMRACDAFDSRDLPKDHVWTRGRDIQAKEAENVRPE